MEEQDIQWFDEMFEPNKDGFLDPNAPNALYEEDDWEDGDFNSKIHDQYPGWFLVKITGFIAKTFIEIEPWLNENVKFGAFKKVGWDSGCSYSVGVVFESSKDAMLFKLRWR